MYHLRLKGAHYQMGVKRGNIFNSNKIVFPLHLDQFQLKHGIESEKILKQYFPEVCDEIKGITDTIKVDYLKFISWMLAMGCCMYNLDKNHPEIRDCTAFAIRHQEDIYYGRNNDLPPYLKAGSKSEIYRPAHGYSFQITTSSFVNGEEGINEKGLAVAMTFVFTDLKHIYPGLNSVFVVRYLLEKAKDVSEAIRLLDELPVASNMNILLVDSSSNMRVVECCFQEKHIRKPLRLHNGCEMICTVNQFTSNKMKKYEMKGDTYRANERYITVYNAFKNYKNENMLDYIQSVLKGEHGFICQYEKQLNFETIWSSIFDLKTLNIYRAEGNPRKKKFIEDKRLTQLSNIG